MNADIELCIKFQNKQQREPLLSHEIFNERYFKVGMDVLTFQNKDYLVIVDYYSKYPELLPLHDKTARKCKSVFSRHSIPVEVVSDNMPFQSVEFLTFAKAWVIKTTTSSPTHSQSNGQAERYVQTVKNMLNKAHEQNQDPYLALLEYRNTPVVGMKYSPAQMLMSRRLRTKIPVATSLLSPKVVDASADLINMQTRQKRYYDRHSKSLPPLKRGDVACYRRNRMWNKSCVVDVRNEPRSYVIRNEHGRMRRNRRDLYKTSLSPQSVERQISHYRSSTPSSSSVTNSNYDGTRVFFIRVVRLYHVISFLRMSTYRSISADYSQLAL